MYQAVPKKFIPSRILSEVIVQPINKIVLQQPSQHVVEAIHQSGAGRLGMVIAARSLACGDVIVTADSGPTKTLLCKGLAVRVHDKNLRWV